MASSKLMFKVITPDEIKDEREADMVIVRAQSGEMGFLPNHEDCSVVLDVAKLRIYDNDKELIMFIESGIAQVRNNVLTILTNDAKWPSELNISQIEAWREEAEQQLKDSKSNLDIHRAQVLLRRLQVQTEVSSYPIINPTDK